MFSLSQKNPSPENPCLHSQMNPPIGDTYSSLAKTLISLRQVGFIKKNMEVVGLTLKTINLTVNVDSA